MRRASERLLRFGRAAAAAAVAAFSVSAASAACDQPVYLTFDTGHMGVADLVADVLQREQVKATFFLADERTVDGGTSLDARWAPWWRARVAEGHVFASHTFDHIVWRRDVSGGFEVRPTAGPDAGHNRVIDGRQYCSELQRSADRFTQITGQRMAPLFRAPAGRTSPALLDAARGCGYQHVGWAPAGFLGDELPSDRYPNAQLLQNALRDIRPGDILLAHLGIWSRRDPWAPAVLQPLIQGLKARGLCFATLAEHPAYRDAVARAASAAQPGAVR
jgi:peptidoglycan-N-acetylmuramic acid deacetylase